MAKIYSSAGKEDVDGSIAQHVNPLHSAEVVGSMSERIDAAEKQIDEKDEEIQKKDEEIQKKDEEIKTAKEEIQKKDEEINRLRGAQEGSLSSDTATL